jgi:hypothetical protein
LVRFTFGQEKSFMPVRLTLKAALRKNVCFQPRGFRDVDLCRKRRVDVVEQPRLNWSLRVITNLQRQLFRSWNIPFSPVHDGYMNLGFSRPWLTRNSLGNRAPFATM